MSSTLNTHMRLEPAPKFCPMCGAPLKTLRTRRRTVHTLTSTLEVTLVEKACGDTGCALCGVALKPPLPLALPYLHYGVDVTLHAATERERGVPASRVFDRRPSPSTVIRHADRLALLGEASASLDEELRDNYIALVDATSDRGNQLTVIDARTGTVLLAEALDGLSYEDLKPHIERLRELFGTPLCVVSDDDRALLKAIREVFPGVPLQYCHFHFLRNLGEDLMGEHHRRVAEAAEEAKSLALAAVKRLGCEELALLVEGYLTVRGRFPFDAPALELYTRLRNLTAEVLSLRVKSRTLTRLKTSFMKVHATLLGAREASETLSLLFTAFGFLRLALADENPEERVREIAAWAESLRGAPREELRPLTERLRRYEERLHTHTRVEGCPRSITELERRFREARRHAGNLGTHPKALFLKNPLAPPTTSIYKDLLREARAREEETRRKTQTRGRAKRDPGWALKRIRELLRELNKRE